MRVELARLFGEVEQAARKSAQLSLDQAD